MHKIGIMADSSSNLEYAPFEHHIRIARTCIFFDKKQYTDGIDFTIDEFYDLLNQSEIIPSTAAPTLQEIVNAIEKCKQDGCDEVIHFPISFELSTYGQNLKQRIDDLNLGVKFEVINPKTACLMQGYQAKYAEILASKGYEFEQIREECDKLAKQTKMYFVVDKLKYLAKSGRLSQFKGYLGDFIQIKPIITFDETGKLVTNEQVRTHKKAIERIVEKNKADVKDKDHFILFVAHTGRYQDALAIKERLEKEIPAAKRVEIFTIAPTVGAHIGSGILGIGYMDLSNLKEAL